MPRAKIELPSSFRFCTEITPRITDINYGGHLGNDSLLSIIHEARVRFLSHYGFSELNIGNVGIILTDAVIVYKSECFYGNSLLIEVDVANFTNCNCDIYYKITEKNSSILIATAKTNIAFYDYKTRKVVKVPESFLSTFLTNEHIFPADT